MRYLFFIFLSSFAISCGDSQAEIDDTFITQYILDNGLDAMKTNSGLYVVINDPGSAEKPIVSSDLTICYEGYELNGDIFDTSYSNGVCTPRMFGLNGTIQGWQEGILFFGKGGKGKLIIPSGLAYGSTGAGSISPDTPIAFDIELIDFN